MRTLQEVQDSRGSGGVDNGNYRAYNSGTLGNETWRMYSNQSAESQEYELLTTQIYTI